MESDNRLISLENEFKIVKGEIKALLIDIREIMNNIENPFYNTQGITDGPDAETKAKRGGDAPGRSIQHEDMLEHAPEREHHPGFAEMPVQQGMPMPQVPMQQVPMQPMGAVHAPNVAETPVQQGMHKPQVPMQQGMPMQQMGGTPEPYHPDFAEMPVQQMGAGHAPNVAETPVQHEMHKPQVPVQHDGTKQEATPEHVPDFAVMFKQYEEAKQSGDDGTTQGETIGHAPDFAVMFKQYEEAKQSGDDGTTQGETLGHAPDFAEMFNQYEEAKQSEGMPEEIPGILHDNGFDIYTLAELMRWTDYTLKTIERGRLDELLDLYMLTGHISEGLKDTISKIADLSTQEVAEGSTPTMKDHIAAMFQLNAVLNPSESDQKAIYSIYGELPWRTVG